MSDVTYLAHGTFWKKLPQLSSRIWNCKEVLPVTLSWSVCSLYPVWLCLGFHFSEMNFHTLSHAGFCFVKHNLYFFSLSVFLHSLKKSNFNLLLKKQTRYSNSHPNEECFCSSTCSAVWIFAFNKFIKNESLQIVFYSCLNYWHIVKLPLYSWHLMLLNITVHICSELVRVPLPAKGEGRTILQCYTILRRMIHPLEYLYLSN